MRMGFCHIHIAQLIFAMVSKEYLHPFSSESDRWWSSDTVAIVTGGNKGIGYALVKRFSELGLTVILTARDYAKGFKAMELLRNTGLDRNVHFSLLDVSNPDSIETFASWFRDNFQGLDILVNNAAVSFNDIEENSVENADTVIKTNFYGPKLLIEALLPFFRNSASKSRILNVSSRLGLLDKLRNQKLKAILQDQERLTEAEIEKIIYLFLKSVKQGTWKNQGWPEIWTDYSVSKIALNAYSKILAKKYEGLSLSVNCFCPGFTQTSMTRGKGTHSAEDAAELGAKLALLPSTKLQTGKIYLSRTDNVLCSRL